MNRSDDPIELEDEFSEEGIPGSVEWDAVRSDRHDASADEGTEPPPVPGAAGQATEVAGSAPDSLLIIGRQASGKSVFLARLFAELDAHEPSSWRRHAMRLHVRGAEGLRLLRSHNRMLSMGKWPGTTTQWVELDLEIEHPLGRRAIKYVDYPGEVFSRAFADGVTDADTDRLLHAVVSASHVVLLLDISQLLVKRDQPDDPFRERERTHNTDGMVELVRLIRESAPSFDDVAVRGTPISIILTKGDSNQTLLAAAACLAESWPKLEPRVWTVESLLPAVLDAARPMVDVDVVTAVAVRDSRRIGGTSGFIPDLDQPSQNLVESIKRVVFRGFLSRLREEATRHSPDADSLRAFIGTASICKLDPSSFAEVRMAENRLRRITGPGSASAGLRAAGLLKQLLTLDPESRPGDWMSWMQARVGTPPRMSELPPILGAGSVPPRGDGP